jgi:hypothetical protein
MGQSVAAIAERNCCMELWSSDYGMDIVALRILHRCLCLPWRLALYVHCLSRGLHADSRHSILLVASRSFHPQNFLNWTWRSVEVEGEAEM